MSYFQGKRVRSRSTNPYYTCLPIAVTYYSKQAGVAFNSISLLDSRSKLTLANKSVVGFSKLDMVPECHRLQEDSLYLHRMSGSHQHAGRQKVMV